MKVYGYEQDSDDILDLNEVSFVSSINEIKKLVEFLEEVIDKYDSSVVDNAENHIHLRDWDEEWKQSEPDIIVVHKNE